MIEMNNLAFRSSSPLKNVQNLEALQRREDLYSPDNFYFGFESSNLSFFDIMNDHRPLAVKYGSVLMVYNQSVAGASFDLYWIDVQKKQLVSLINIKTKPQDNDLIEEIIPFEFKKPYFNHSRDDELIAEQPTSSQDPLFFLAYTIEQLTIGVWPDNEQYQQLSGAIDEIQRKSYSNSEITCANLPLLQHQLHREEFAPSVEHFVTPYSLTDGNPDLGIGLLLKRHPVTITARIINDEYPRIELIIPDEIEEERYMAVYNTRDPELFSQLNEVLTDSKQLSALLKTHFPERIARYFAQQDIQQGPTLSK